MGETLDVLLFVLGGLAVLATPVFVIWFALRFLSTFERSAKARERIARALEEDVKLRAEQRAFGSNAAPPGKW